MKRVATVCLALVCYLVPVEAQDEAPATQPAVRFGYVDVFVDSGTAKLAAYQFELKAAQGTIRIVGVEGGEHAAWKDAPYYDPAALKRNRIIIAAFNTGRDLPSGRTRVARVHLQITGPTRPEYVAQLQTAASADGKRIPATLTIGQGDTK